MCYFLLHSGLGYSFSSLRIRDDLTFFVFNRIVFHTMHLGVQRYQFLDHQGSHLVLELTQDLLVRVVLQVWSQGVGQVERLPVYS